MLFLDPFDRYGHAIYASFNQALVAEGWLGIRMKNVCVINPRKQWWLVYEHEHDSRDEQEVRRISPLMVIWGSERNARMRAARTYRPNVYNIYVKPLRFRSEARMKYIRCEKCRGRGQCWEYDPRCYNCFGLGHVEWRPEDEPESDSDDDDDPNPRGNLVNKWDPVPEPQGEAYYSDDEKYERRVCDIKDARFKWQYKDQEHVDLDCMFLRAPLDDDWHENGWQPMRKQ